MPRQKSPNSKAEFIRKVPLTVSTEDVIARAAEAGHKLTPGYVQTTRSGMRKAERDKKAQKAPKLAKEGEIPATDAASSAAIEAEFVRFAIHDIGLKKARHLLDNTEAQLLRVVNGGN